MEAMKVKFTFHKILIICIIYEELNTYDSIRNNDGLI